MAPAATATVAAIRALQPYSISWSNVGDYFSPKEFHTMAKACSAPADTVHYLHTMNWVRDIMGSCYMDFLLCYSGPDRSKASACIDNCAGCTAPT